MVFFIPFEGFLTVDLLIDIDAYNSNPSKSVIGKSRQQLIIPLHCRLLRIGLTVPEMDIAGLYRINGEVFILPLEGGGSFSSKMSRVTATGHSTILPYTNEEGNQVQWGEL